MVTHPTEALGERARGVRLNPRNSAIVTARIRVAQILEKLQDHVLGVIVIKEDGTSEIEHAELSASQIKAAEILLSKTLGNAPPQEPPALGEDLGVSGDRYALTDEQLLWIAAQGRARLTQQVKAAKYRKAKANGNGAGGGNAPA